MSCDLSPFSSPEDSPSEIPDQIVEVAVNTDLFIENENCFIFETNDPKYVNASGYTFWTTKNTNTSNSFESIETTLYKKSGNTLTGYGIIFAQQKYVDKDYLITVMINTTGNFIVGKVVNGKFEVMKDWDYCDYLNKYLNSSNTIKVEFFDEKFHVFLNNYEVYEFAVTESISYKDSKSGYVAVVSSTEHFPEEKVEVVYLK